MKKLVVFFTAMFLGLCITNCADMGMQKRFYDNPSYIPPGYSNQIVDTNVVPKDFINITEKMVANLVNCDTITKSSKPSLIVAHTINNTSKKEFNTTVYTKSLRNLLINQYKEKARFIDKETSEKADYFLLGTISDVGTSGYNDSSEPYPSECQYWKRGADFNMMAQIAEEETQGPDEGPNVILKAYKFSMQLTNSDSGKVVWEESKEFKRKEIQSASPSPKRRYRVK